MHRLELRRIHPDIYEWFSSSAIPFICQILPEITRQATGNRPSFLSFSLVEPANHWPRVKAYNHNPNDPDAKIWLTRSDYHIIDATSALLTKLTIEQHRLHVDNFNPGLVARTVPGYLTAHYEIMPKIKSFHKK